MKPLDDPEVREWLLKVAEDCRVAEVLSASAEPLDDAICFHCQQAAEKLLKALLVADGVPPPRTHDLESLADLLSSAQSLPEDLEDALTHLSELSVIPRYPVSSERRSPDRAQRAMDALDRTIAWVQFTYGWKVPRRPDRPESGD